MKLERKERLAWNVGGVVLFITIWEGFGQWLGSRIISPPSLVAIDYVQLLEEGVMLRELLFSLRQMLVGFGLACALGMPLGVLMGRYKTVEHLATPWIGMFLVTSVASLVPLFILLLGTGFAFRRSEEHTSELQSLMRISYA